MTGLGVLTGVPGVGVGSLVGVTLLPTVGLLLGMALLTLLDVLATEAMRGLAPSEAVRGLAPSEAVRGLAPTVRGLAPTEATRGEGLARAVVGRGEGLARGEGVARTEPLDPDGVSLVPLGIVLLLLGVLGEILLPDKLPDLFISREPDLLTLPLLAER